MGSVSLINRVKYSKALYVLYNRLGNLAIRIIKIFVKTQDDLVVFASFGGRKFDDSPKAIYEAMLKDKRFDGYKLVWAFLHPNDYDLVRGEIVKIDTLKYYKTLLRARVWITNSSMTRGLGFTGINTFELNTWHGSAIKKLGGDINKGNTSFGITIRKRNKGVMLAQGQFDVDVFSHAFRRKVEDFRIIGLPRNDALANSTLEIKECIKEKLGIPKGKKVILYAPTFREYDKDNSNNCVLDVPLTIPKWKNNMAEDFVFLLRAHYEVVKTMNIIDDDFVKNVSAYPNLNELMIASDILISDYSSIFFDYAIQGKPMLCFAYDYDRYEHERGMYFDIRDYLPYAENEDELIELVKLTDVTRESNATIAFQNKFVTAFGSASVKALDLIYENI